MPNQDLEAIADEVVREYCEYHGLVVMPPEWRIRLKQVAMDMGRKMWKYAARGMQPDPASEPDWHHEKGV